MERIINLHIEKLPEGYYQATSDTIQGLVAQGRTIAETIEIAKDVAKKLLEAQEDQIQYLNPLKDLSVPIRALILNTWDELGLKMLVTPWVPIVLLATVYQFLPS